MLLFLFLVCLVLGAVPPSDEQELRLQRGGCPMFWYSFNNRCYKYVASFMTWGDAEFECVSQGANLVSIHTLQEENFVKMLIRNFDPAQGNTWIGLTDSQTERVWLWSDGSRINFTHWDNGQPNSGTNEDCGHTNWGSAKKWNDASCSLRYSFVCKSRPVCA